jgi:3-deoxy-manno-octulosonate cytidylyltransferase (CMP-KDO synthetase)
LIAKVLAVIPARYASSRLPAKALAQIGTKPMVQLVYEAVSACPGLAYVVVATDHQLIFDTLAQQGIPVLMTAPSHQNGTERCAEVLALLNQPYDYVLNVQGDEPFIQSAQIALLLALLDGRTEIATLVKKITDAQTLLNSNSPKVVINSKNEALYFSRQPIPYLRQETNCQLWPQLHSYYKHIGIYAYRSDILLEIVKLGMGQLEKAESLEQLRWLEGGYKIKTAITPYDSMGIDTPEDLAKANQYYKNNI